MKFHDTSIQGLRKLEIEAHADPRGLFAEGFAAWWFEVIGEEFRVRMANLARSDARGTVRGLHWQAEPHAQAKIVFCTTGLVFDQVVDVRPDSKTRGLSFGCELAPFVEALFIPRGLAHGWQALEAGSSILYLLGGDYSPRHERGIRYDSVRWPAPIVGVNDRDRAWPALKEVLGDPGNVQS